MANIVYRNDDPFYMTKKHYCPACNVALKKVKVSQIVDNSSQEDAQKNTTLFSDTRIGSRGIQLRKYKYIGETKYVWKEFDCEQCGRHFTVTQIKNIESAPQERKKELLAHFDASPKQENEPIRETEKGMPKEVKLALCISIPIIVAIFILVICLLPKIEYADTNGPDNFALNTITREDILSSNQKHSASHESKKFWGNDTNIRNGIYQEYDRDNVTCSYGRIDGIDILQVTKISSNTLTLNINSVVEEGNAEIVILVDGDYYCSVDVNQNKAIILQNVADKTIIVKLAAESAKMRVDISRDY